MTPVSIRLPEKHILLLDNLCKKWECTRSDAIRRLVTPGLKTAQKGIHIVIEFPENEEESKKEDSASD